MILTFILVFPFFCRCVEFFEWIDFLFHFLPIFFVVFILSHGFLEMLNQEEVIYIYIFCYYESWHECPTHLLSPCLVDGLAGKCLLGNISQPRGDQNQWSGGCCLDAQPNSPVPRLIYYGLSANVSNIPPALFADWLTIRMPSMMKMLKPQKGCDHLHQSSHAWSSHHHQIPEAISGHHLQILAATIQSRIFMHMLMSRSNTFFSLNLFRFMLVLVRVLILGSDNILTCSSSQQKK